MNPKTMNIAAACLALALIIFALGGCRTARMAVPPVLTAVAPEMPVRGRMVHMFDHEFAFGPYRITDAHRGWTASDVWGAAWAFLDYHSRSSSQDIEFKITGPDNQTWQARCTTQAGQQILTADGGRDRGELSMELSGGVSFFCAFLPPTGGRTWRLALGRRISEATMDGWLLGPGTRTRVTGTQRLEGSPIPLSDPTGYILEAPDGLAAAVEVINDGAVWIAPAIHGPQRSALAAAAAGLLMYEDITEK